MDAPELSVVLVNHNGADCLPAALDALRANTSEPEVEVVVVDSASSDGSWEGLHDRWDRVRVLRFDHNIGFAAGCNRGAEAARGRLVAFVNFDGEVEPGWDGPLRAALDGDAGVSVAGGALVRPDGVTLEAAGLAIAPNMATYGQHENVPRTDGPQRPFDTAAASGALMMLRREQFLALGGFHEPIWMYGEEADLCLRAPGRTVIDPRSAIRHEMGHAAGPERSATRLYWPSRNRLMNAARHLPAGRMLLSVAASAGFDLLTLAQLRSGAAVRAVARGWRDGLRLMPRERRARTRAQRRAAAARVVPLRAAIAQQRRLGRLRP